MRTAIFVSITILMFSSLAFNSVSIFDRTVEQSFFSTENQKNIAKKNSKKRTTKKPEGTPYRGSGRIEFM